jgi:type VI secretion system protein ImpG
MDRRFVEYFEEELTHVRRMADEFKAVHPKVAARLQLGQDPPDPYVQQLLDGFAFLAARVQLKLDAEFPRFIEGLLQTVYPHYLAPIPAMAIVEFEPQFDNGELAEGPIVARGTRLDSKWLPGAVQDAVRCTFTTAHDLQLLPIRLTDARYYTRDRDLSEIDNRWASGTGTKAAIRLRLEATAGLTFNQISAEKLVIHLPPRENLTGILYEQLLAHSSAVVIQSAPKGKLLTTYSVKQPAPVRGMGFEDSEALLPVGPQGFSGYRILQEYFAFPGRFFFIEVSGLREGFAKCPGTELDLILCFDSEEHRLEERRLQLDCFALHRVPAINLFEKENIIVDLKEEREEHEVVPDATKKLEYEVYSVKSVVGRPHGQSKPDPKFEFQPFYFASQTETVPAGFFTTRRVPRKLGVLEIRHSPVSDYLGTDVFLALSGESLESSLSQLSSFNVTALCTNRHLSIRHSEIQFDPSVGPVNMVRTVAKTPPRSPHAADRLSWRLISHLTLNYRALLSADGRAGAAAIQELLRLYVASDREADTSQIRALKKAAAKPVFRRVETLGPIAYARGLCVELEIDETPFKDTGVFLLGAVLDRFFSRYVTLNSFVQTELYTTSVSNAQGRKVFQWPISKGMRQIL